MKPAQISQFEQLARHHGLSLDSLNEEGDLPSAISLQEPVQYL